MPELPELHGMAQVINAHASGRIFINCKKSTLTKLPSVKVPKGSFTIHAQSRGKELMMTLQPVSLPENDAALFDNADKFPHHLKKATYILCNMGMTGFFEAVPAVKEKHRHAHLSFQATDGSILSYVDVRRFGTWRSVDSLEWPVDRGPDPVQEHDKFRQNVVRSFSANPKKFDKVPICLVLHDQGLFNGIGNYLRAEILFRAGIAPFASAKDVLASLKEVADTSHPSDLLTLCRDVPNEVIALRINKYQGGKQNTSTDSADSVAANEGDNAWAQWLKVYGHDNASWAVDKDGRRIWFRGPPGKLYRAFAQKGYLQGKGHFTGALASATKRPAAMKRPATLTKKRPSSFSGSTRAMKTQKKVLKKLRK